MPIANRSLLHKASRIYGSLPGLCWRFGHGQKQGHEGSARHGSYAAKPCEDLFQGQGMKELSAFPRIADLTGWHDVVFGVCPRLCNRDEMIPRQFNRRGLWDAAVRTGIVKQLFDRLPLFSCDRSHTSSFDLRAPNVVSPAPKGFPLWALKPGAKRGAAPLSLPLLLAFLGLIEPTLMRLHPELVVLCFPILRNIGFPLWALLPLSLHVLEAWALAIALCIQPRSLKISFSALVLFHLCPALRRPKASLFGLSTSGLALWGLCVFQVCDATAGSALRLKPIALSLIGTKHGEGEELPAC